MTDKMLIEEALDLKEKGQMEQRKVLQILQQAKDFLTQGWNPKYNSANMYGMENDHILNGAVAWCIPGSIDAAMEVLMIEDNVYDDLVELCIDALTVREADGKLRYPGDWEMDTGRTHEEVLQLLDTTIEEQKTRLTQI